MGLFDIFKKKEQSKSVVQDQPSEAYLGDLDKTNIIFHLVQIPRSERDENWTKTFLENVGMASFRCGEEQIITGPDGFPYFQLLLPEPGNSFQCFVIDKMKDDFLLNSGFGVVVNPTGNSADWVFSYGDILNYHLNKTFLTGNKTHFSKENEVETISANEEVLIGQPSEVLLPKNTRKLLHEFLKANGVKNPKILLLMRRLKNEAGVSQDLVFNITPTNFENENIYRSVMQTISWYLPRHYTIIGMEEKSMGGEFMEL